VGKYVVDTDTGVDDAMAILQILAARKKGQVDKRL
jgi:inosine-uridine nucleoside N-ribohydrolase